MSNSDASGCLGAFLIISKIASWIGSGVISWNWIEPDSFGRAIIFLIIWGIMGYIIDMILALILAGLASMFD